MRKIRPYGSEGGGAARSPYPYQKFDICGVKERKSPIREPLKVTRKGDFIERLGKPKAYTVGMQIPHRVYPEIPEESVIWCLAPTNGRFVERVSRATREPD